MPVWSRAPSRIDLAGGTLDIWPLYLLMEHGLTVNIAVTLHSQVWLRTGENPGYRLVSEDTGLEVRADSLADLDRSGPLALVARAVRHFAPAPGLTVVTRNDAPRGSGLGASSSLLAALLAALQRLADRPPATNELINLAADLEAQVVRIPTGKQDYYAAVYGGANAIWFEAGRNRIENLPLTESFARQLRTSMILAYAGEPHDSAPTNWRAFKGYVEGRPEVVSALDRIRDIAERVREAWLAEDLELLVHLVGEEWRSRVRLARGLVTPRLQRAMAAATRAGAVASKVCGAGGGGCLVTFVREGRREAVTQALRQAGAQPLDFEIDTEGLVVREASPGA